MAAHGPHPDKECLIHWTSISSTFNDIYGSTYRAGNQTAAAQLAGASDGATSPAASGHPRWTVKARFAIAIDTRAGRDLRRLPQHGSGCLRSPPQRRVSERATRFGYQHCSVVTPGGARGCRPWRRPRTPPACALASQPSQGVAGRARRSSDCVSSRVARPQGLPLYQLASIVRARHATVPCGSSFSSGATRAPGIARSHRAACLLRPGSGLRTR